MAKSPNQTNNPAVAVVANLKPAQGTIRPPDGWVLNSQHGILRFDASASGLLVRLADLVQWLMDTRELPCGVALELVCTELESGRADGCMYMLNAGGYATALGPDDCFAYRGLGTWSAFAVPEKEDCGLAGAVKHMRDYWSSAAAPSAAKYIGHGVLDPLAIRLDKAFELWGYGHVDAGVPKDVPDVAAWTGERLAAELAALKVRGKAEGFKDHTKRLATLAGISPREVRRRIEGWNHSRATGKAVSNALPWGSSTTQITKANAKK